MLMGSQMAHQVLPGWELRLQQRPCLAMEAKVPGLKGARPEGGLPWWSYWLPGPSTSPRQTRVGEGGGG